MAKLLRVLDRQIELLGEGGQPDYEVIRGIAEHCLDFPDQCHHPKEDLVLEKLRLRDPEAAGRVGDLEGEHAKLAALTRRFADGIEQVLLEAELPRDWLHAIAQEFEGAYRVHMAMEEQVYFPAAERALGAADWAEIDARATDREDPLFGARVAKRFHALSVNPVFTAKALCAASRAASSFDARTIARERCELACQLGSLGSNGVNFQIGISRLSVVGPISRQNFIEPTVTWSVRRRDCRYAFVARIQSRAVMWTLIQVSAVKQLLCSLAVTAHQRWRP